MAVTVDMKAYANGIIDKLIALKDSNKNVLAKNEIDTLNAACNLIDHNIEELKKP